MNDVEKELIFSTIMDAEVDGFGIRLKLHNGKVFNYDASDGGYSTWEITEEERR